MNSVIVCQCAEHGSINFHEDEKETVVVIDGKIYELVASERTLEELLELPVDEAPHIRHLNHNPRRTKKEQKVYQEKSAHKNLEAARETVKEKQAEEYKVQKAKTAAQQPIIEKAPRKQRVSKIRQVIEELHKRAMTVRSMMDFEIAKSTAETLKYDLRRVGYKLAEETVEGEVTLKILEDPKKV